jgi:hypothetical protein
LKERDPLRSRRYDDDDDDEVDLKSTGWEDVCWIILVQDHCWPLVNTVMNLRVPYNARCFLIS